MPSRWREQEERWNFKTSVWIYAGQAFDERYQLLRETGAEGRRRRKHGRGKDDAGQSADAVLRGERRRDLHWTVSDTKEMNRSALRSNFGMVLQDTWLFGGTIADNIAYSRPGARREEVSGAKAARVDFFVRTMPHGYDTILNDDTETISVGQRQLLTIASVFLRNPSVIILDEATSSVDTRTEAEIGKAMKALMKGRTSFVIAHRLSTITDADLILFMRDGNIIEQGTHKTLLQKNGAYAELYYSQFA